MRVIWMTLFCLHKHAGTCDSVQRVARLSEYFYWGGLRSTRIKPASVKYRIAWTGWALSLMSTGPPE